jgi:hypothetical protein
MSAPDTFTLELVEPRERATYCLVGHSCRRVCNVTPWL